MNKIRRDFFLNVRKISIFIVHAEEMSKSVQMIFEYFVGFLSFEGNNFWKVLEIVNKEIVWRIH